MSLIRRISLAATAATAALAFAIPSSASAISISGGRYDVSGSWTYFDLASPTAASDLGVWCYHYGSRIGYGWGVATGQAATPFVPPFDTPYPETGGGNNCYLEDGDSFNAVRADVAGGLKLTLTDLAPGQDPLSPRRSYIGRLGFDPNVSMQFQLLSIPGCTVTVAGPQSVEVGETAGWITVDDDHDFISLDLNLVELAVTKTAACPSSINHTMMVIHPFGASWDMYGVTVTH